MTGRVAQPNKLQQGSGATAANKGAKHIEIFGLIWFKILVLSLT